MQYLRVEPESELNFEGSFKEIIEAGIILTNISDKVVSFKVKTTAPRQYCVRPNCGFIKPSKKVTVTVMLQPFIYDPNDKLKHKFLIQSVPVEGSQIDSPEQLWSNVKPENVAEHKLKCVFEYIERPTTTKQNVRQTNPQGQDIQVQRGFANLRTFGIVALIIIIAAIIAGVGLGQK